ncbi:hypothetical protein [Proteocatella sphenisci]|uniref:hypothetical protein n=1 Tax=Proteocatella sphenisci TaxID=181070 RepID=UPI00048C60EF|nr:hypothetical protein [Proteocatella sphenisci]
MKRDNIIKLFETNNLVDYQLENEKDLVKVFGVDTKQIEGYSTLSDRDKIIFNDFIVSFYNMHGIDAKLCITPESIYFVEEFESAIKDPEEFKSIITDSEEDFYTLPYEYKVTALDKNEQPIKILYHTKIDEHDGCEVVSTEVKHYLRFTYIYKYEENTKREWLHIMNGREWY